MARNKIIVTIIGLVIAIGVLGYAVALVMSGRSGESRVAGNRMEATQPEAVDATAPDQAAQPSAAKPEAGSESATSTKPAVEVTQAAGAKATEGNPSATKSGKMPEARKPGQPGQRPNGPNAPGRFRRGGMGVAFLMMGIGGLEESGKAPLTASQAKQILALVEPLSKQKTLDDAKAQEATKKINDLLTDKQREAMMSAFRDRPGRPEGQPREPRPEGDARPPRPERPDGEARQPRPDGPRPPAFDMNANPLDPTGDTPFAQRIKAVYDKLKAKAK